MKISLWLGPSGLNTLRFDEVELSDIADLMRSVAYRRAVQVSDHQRNIIGTWRAGELREAATELARWRR